jgi:hypothetical protein
VHGLVTAVCGVVDDDVDSLAKPFDRLSDNLGSRGYWVSTVGLYRDGCRASLDLNARDNVFRLLW